MSKSLNTAFVNYYKKKLEPLGFRKVKGNQPYFVRVVNDEILHIITCMKSRFSEPGCEAFQLMCGVATVYRRKIDLSVLPKETTNWMRCLGDIYRLIESVRPVKEYVWKDRIMNYSYKEDTLEEVMESSESGVDILLGELGRVMDMDGVLRYLMKFDSLNVRFSSMLNDNDIYDNEGLYYARREFDFSKIERIYDEKKYEAKNEYSEEKLKKRYEELEEWIYGIREGRNKFINDEEAYIRGMEILKERYEKNIETLQRYGLDIKKKY